MAFYDLKEKKKNTQQGLTRKRPFRLLFQRVGRAAPLGCQGKYAIGVWGHTTDLNDQSQTDSMGNPIKREGTYGIYALAEQIVFREIQDREQNLTLFGRIGFADPRVHRFSQYYGGGFVYRGLFPSREDDEFGFGVGAVLNGNHFKRTQKNRGNTVDDSEISLEMTYSFNILPEMIVQPDLQYIMNPDTDPKVKNALVIGARIVLNLNWFGDFTMPLENPE